MGNVQRLSPLMQTALVFSALSLPCIAAEGHWAYIAPVRQALPTVERADWPREPVDAFVLSSLKAAGLQPAGEADRRTLARRASLALAGLPLTPDELHAFLADTAPDAYDRLIDRLLTSPHYGERMALDWLDMARYADTHGYHSDSERVMWPWRDWVIDALNANLPYDQFTIEQLAGDLLPNAKLSQRLATGLQRNHMLNDENGAIADEYRAEYVADRVATLGAIWLGQTLACARCHDHKHDPLTQREYYQLFAFFNNVPENGLGGKAGNAPPTLAVPTPLQQHELAEIAERLTALEAGLTERAASAEAAFQKWLQTATSDAAGKRLPDDAALHLPLDGAVDVDAGRVEGEATWVAGKLRQALLIGGETHIEAPRAIRIDSDQPFAFSAWVFSTTRGKLGIAGSVDEAQSRRGWELVCEEGRLVLRLTHVSGTDEIEVRTQAPLAQRKWQHVGICYDGSGAAKGLRLYVNGAEQPLETVRDDLRGHIVGDQPLTIGRTDAKTPFRGMLDEVRLFTRDLESAEMLALAGGNPVGELLAIPVEDRTAEQVAALRRHYLEHHDAIYAAQSDEALKLRARRDAIWRSAPAPMVMQEMAEPRQTFVLERGLYDQPGEKVTAGTPGFLPPPANEGSLNRLHLAQWLVDPNHPLTSRVAVNRAWQTLFGAGLVRTPDDFGVRGERPTHPALLDWLAREYADRGWDTKRLHRRLVTSATFRQKSAVTPGLAERDPDNRLWARGPRYRLPAEIVRDQALAATGLLERQMGGPGVRPYQPAELWRELAYDPNDYTAQVFVPGTGADLYRRSVYTFWKRSVPPPNLSLFDAPDRETCTALRTRSNTPLAALVLLNDATYVEAARRLAELVLLENMATDEARSDALFVSVLSRPATPDERRAILSLLASQRAEFRSDRAGAERLLKVGDSSFSEALVVAELAAWTVMASTVLNLDETATLR